MIISMEYKDIKGVLVWISQKDSSVSPFSLFISFSLFSIFLYFLWPQWLLLFNSHLSSLGSFIVSTLGSFPHLRAPSHVLRKDIRRLMMTERIMPRVWMYRRRWTPTLGVRRRQCTERERLAKYGKVEVSTFNTYISPKNSCTYYR